jgi:segregation and condensation protein B
MRCAPRPASPRPSALPIVDGAIRAPQPGAPFAYVTTRKFLEAFGFASLRELPDLERLKAEGLLERDGGEAELNSALGLGDAEDDGDLFPGNAELDEEETI